MLTTSGILELTWSRLKSHSTELRPQIMEPHSSPHPSGTDATAGRTQTDLARWQCSKVSQQSTLRQKKAAYAAFLKIELIKRYRLQRMRHEIHATSEDFTMLLNYLLLSRQPINRFNILTSGSTISHILKNLKSFI